MRDTKRIKRDERYFSLYIIEYIIICNTCPEWNSQAAIISREVSLESTKRKLATRWKSADSVLTSVCSRNRFNDNKLTIWISPRKNGNADVSFFPFFFLNIPPFGTKGKAFITRRTISRAPRNNALFEARLVGAINFFLFLRRDYRHLQLNWSIRAFYLIFIAHQFSTIRFRCEKDVRTKRNASKMGKSKGKEE